MAWLVNLAIALDQLVNVLAGGVPDETLSSRAHRMRTKGQRYWGWTARTIDFIFFWQDDHCRSAYLSEREGLHLPPEVRDKNL